MSTAKTLAFVDGMDNINKKNKQFTETENGHEAYSWNNDDKISVKSVKEKFVQLYFQCVLNKKPVVNDNIVLQNKFEELINSILSLKTEKKQKKYLDYVSRFIMQNRDIVNGKGLYEVTFYFLEVYAYYTFEYRVFDENYYFSMITKIVSEIDNQHSLGSWKDLKMYLHFLINSKTFCFNNKYELICQHIEKIYIPEMIQDRKNMSIGENISLCGKWLPRESTKKYKWLARLIAKLYYQHVYQTSNVTSSVASYEYRRLCSSLNKYLDTTQIHMCNRTWDVINFDHVTSLTLHKSKDAFLNKSKINEEHRNICRDNLLNYISAKVAKNEALKGKVMFPSDLVKQVLYTSIDMDETNKNIINLQWKGLVESVKKNDENFLHYCIPCIDVSPSMYHYDNSPLLSSIGMGLMATECSTIGRAFTFAEVPHWIEFDEDETFVSKVNKVRNESWGGTTDIYRMFNMMLDNCIKNNVPNEELEKYSLFIFSDMQFNQCDSTNNVENKMELVERLKKLFGGHGYTNIPYIIFWNLTTTGNFPTIEKTPGATMLSGNSASLFKFFMNTTLDKVKKMTNWTLIKEILDNDRYNI